MIALLKMPHRTVPVNDAGSDRGPERRVFGRRKSAPRHAVRLDHTLSPPGSGRSLKLRLA